MIRIDGRAFKIGVQSLQRTARFQDYYSEITEDGVLQMARLGTYFDYTLTLAPAFLPLAEYNDFYSILTAPTAFHLIEIVVPSGDALPFKATVSNVSDSLVFVTPTSAYWDSLSVQFAAREPARKAS